MKIYIGPHKNWIGPYQIADWLQYVGVNEDTCHKIGGWLDSTWVGPFLQKIHNKRKSRKVTIHIDNYDTWSMDNTLAYIVLPMLKQLKETKHGSGLVADEDVPEAIRSTSAPPKENEWDTDDFVHDRWDYVLDQMIYAFDQIYGDNNWEAPYFEHPPHELTKDLDLDEQIAAIKYDHEGREAHQKKITEGFRLFGKYFQNLWD